MGKTAIIKTLLYKLQQEVKEINEKMLVLYSGGFSGETDLITRQDTDIGFKFVASQLFDPKLLPKGK